MIWYMDTRNWLSEDEVVTKFFSWECALIKIKELKRLQKIEDKYNSIRDIIT
jgi:hypothetical protein